MHQSDFKTLLSRLRMCASQTSRLVLVILAFNHPYVYSQSIFHFFSFVRIVLLRDASETEKAVRKSTKFSEASFPVHRINSRLTS